MDEFVGWLEKLEAANEQGSPSLLALLGQTDWKAVAAGARSMIVGKDVAERIGKDLVAVAVARKPIDYSSYVGSYERPSRSGDDFSAGDGNLRGRYSYPRRFSPTSSAEYLAKLREAGERLRGSLEEPGSIRQSSSPAASPAFGLW